MKNGDRITGSIVKQDGKTITMKTELFGTVTAPWDQVASVSSDQPVNVVAKDGKTAVGTLTPRQGSVEVVAADTKMVVPVEEVTAMRNADEQRHYERLLRPGWGQLWAGTINLGLAGSAGNARTLTFTTGVNAARVTNTDKTSLYFSLIKASAMIDGISEDTAQAVRGGVAYSRNIKSRMFVNVFNDYEYDRFQNLDLRFVLGGGAGYQAIKTDRTRWDLLAGFDFSHAKFNTPLTRDAGEFYWGDDYLYKMNSVTSVVQTFRMFNDLTNRGSYRMNFDLGMSTKLSSWLSWTVSFSDRYLNRPAPGRKTNDLLYTTGLGINFAR